VDIAKLTTSDKVIAGSGLLLFVAYFLPWFEVSYPGNEFIRGGSESFNGSDVDFFWSTFPMLIGLVMLGLVVASRLFDVKLPDLPIPWGQAFFGLGVLAALLVVLKLILGEDEGGAALLGIDVSRSFGLFLAALAAIGLAVGGFLKFQEGEDQPAGGADPGSAPF
jgi:hypothetical protein